MAEHEFFIIDRSTPDAAAAVDLVTEGLYPGWSANRSSMRRLVTRVTMFPSVLDANAPVSYGHKTSDGRLVAAGTIREELAASAPVVLIDTMAVALEHRRQGIGGDMVKLFAYVAKASGATALGVELLTPGMDEYFARQGFVADDRLRDQLDADNYPGIEPQRQMLFLPLGEDASATNG